MEMADQTDVRKLGSWLAGRQWKYGIFVLILDFLKNSEKLRVEFPGRNMLQGTENYLELHFY